MTGSILDLIAGIAWWGLLVGFAGLMCVLVLAVFFHAFPNGGDE